MRYFIPDAALIGNSFVIESVADALITNVPANINAVYVMGYNNPGDNGCANYKKSVAEPTHGGKFQSGDGAWWELCEPIVCPEMFGGFPDGSDSDVAMVALMSYNYYHFRNGISVRLYGEYKFTVEFTLKGYNCFVEGGALYNTDQNYSLGVGSPNGAIVSTTYTTSMAVGDSSLDVTDPSLFEIGDRVMLTAGRSVNSAGLNNIPKVKQCFYIIDIVGDTLSFSESSSFAFDHTDDDPNCILLEADNFTVRNVRLINDEDFTGPYLHFVSCVGDVLFDNVGTDAYSSFGACAFANLVEYRACYIIGYNSGGPARGTISYIIRDSEYHPRFENPEEISVFVEESTNFALLDNFKSYGGVVTFTSGADADVTKQYEIRGGYYKNHNGVAIQNAVSGFTDDSYIKIDGATIDCPGFAVAGKEKCAIMFLFGQRAYISNIICPNLDADAFIVGYNEATTSGFSMEGLFNIGSGKGALKWKNIDNYVKIDNVPMDISDDISGYRYPKFDVRKRIIEMDYYFVGYDPATDIDILTLDRPNGGHLYGIEGNASGVGLNIGFGGYVSQEFGAVPNVPGGIGVASFLFDNPSNTSTRLRFNSAAAWANDVNLNLRLKIHLLGTQPNTIMTIL